MLAFEYQGQQHYEFTKIFHLSKEDFEKQKERDKRKKELCSNNKIKLIEIPYSIKKEFIKDYIISKLKENNFKITIQSL